MLNPNCSCLLECCHSTAPFLGPVRKHDGTYCSLPHGKTSGNNTSTMRKDSALVRSLGSAKRTHLPLCTALRLLLSAGVKTVVVRAGCGRTLHQYRPPCDRLRVYNCFQRRYNHKCHIRQCHSPIYCNVKNAAPKKPTTSDIFTRQP